MKPVLYVGNQNYSSWSLRPWLALKWAGLDFETRVIPLGGPGYMTRQMAGVLAVSPTGTVPALHVGAEIISDSLAISEWAAEERPGLWPGDAIARAQARSAACEMHSGFFALRSNLPCNIRRRASPRQWSDNVRRDIERVDALWTTLRARFATSGAYLFGDSPGIADAFYTPLATRFRTYGVTLTADAQRYVDALLANPAFREWEVAGNAEIWTMPEWDSV